MKYFIGVVCVVVLTAVIAGFLIVGSPAQERLRRFDQQRVQDLQMLQSELINYWQNKGVLPEKLAKMEDATRGVAIPHDPQSGADYSYRIVSKESFELCADFAKPTDSEETGYPSKFMRPLPYGSGADSNWQHESGKKCFLRTIDKDFFKPAKPEEKLPQ